MMKKILIRLSTIALIIFWEFTGMSSVTAQTWEPVDGGGVAGINSALATSSVNPSAAVFNGELYAVWKESTSGVAQVHIKKYNGLTWYPAGNTAGQSQLNTGTSDAVDPKIIAYNGALYAAWEEYESGITNIHVKKYNGSSWTFVQSYAVGDGRVNINRGSTSTNATKVDLIVFNNELYAAWIEQDGGGTNYQQIRVAKFNGSLWTNVDGGGNYGLNYNILASTYFVSLVVYNNKLYVTWTENSSSYAILHIKRYDGGSTWTFIDGNSADGLNYDPIKSVNNAPSLSSYNGKLYAFWSENNKIRVKQYDEVNGWTSEPDGGTNGWNYSAINGAYNPSSYAYGNNLYVSWENTATTTPVTRQIRVVSFDGATKNFIDGNAMTGINQNTAMKAHYPKLTDYNGDLYAIWNEDNGGSDAAQQIRAKKYSLPPFVESVSVPANATYASGQAMNFTANFSKAVNVSGGTPYIPVTLNTGGTVNATYVSGSGTKALVFRYTVVSGNEDNDGVTAGSSITLPGGCTLRSLDDTPLDANLTLNNTGSTTGVKVDAKVPTITAANIALNNNYIDLTFSEGIYGAANGTTALTASKLAISFIQNSGTATGAVISSVKKNDNVVEGSASALTGGETTVRVFLTITGTPNGIETIEIKPTDATSVYDQAGNALAISQTTWVKNLNDNTPPVILSATRTDDTHLVVGLSKNCVNIAKANNGGFVLHQTGQPLYTYIISSIAQGSDASHVVLTTEDLGSAGMEGLTVKYTAGGNGTIQDNFGNALATNGTGVSVAPWDVTAPAIVSGSMAPDNSYIDVTFSEGVYGTSDGVTPLAAGSVSLDFTRNGGNVTNMVVCGVRKNNNTSLSFASILTGGETTVRVFFTVTGGLSDGTEMIELRPSYNFSIYDKAGNPMTTSQSTGTIHLIDNEPPTMVSAQRIDDTHINVIYSEDCSSLVHANNGGFYIAETGAPGITYAVSSTNWGGDNHSEVLTLANMAISAKEGVTVTYQHGGNGTVGDLSSNNNQMATNSTGINVAPWDVTAPSITSAMLAWDNSFIDINLNEGIYGAANGIAALTASQLSITFSKNTGGNATGAVISSIRKNDNTVEGAASALTGGETTVRAFLSVTGTPSGLETIEIKPVNAISIFDKAGNAALASLSTGTKALNDKLAPAVLSITRLTPAATLTNATTVIYRVTFSENVNDVDAGDFLLTSTGTAAGTVVSVSSGSGSGIDVTVNSVSGNGTLRLDLKSSGTGIYDDNYNAISGGFTGGQTYTIDHQAPSVNSILSLSGSPTGSAFITYQVTFNENVNNVDVGDFSLSAVGVTGNIVSVSASSGTTIDVTINAVSGYGTLQLTLNGSGTGITDDAGNAITGGYSSGTTIMVDRIYPMVNSINRQTPSGPSTNAATLVYWLNFTESVTGVDVSDFSLTKTGTAAGSVASVSGSDGSYYITVNSVSGNGDLRLDLNSSGTSIADQVGNPIMGGYLTGQTYTIDNTTPTVSSVNSTTVNGTYKIGDVIPITVTFSEAVTVTGTPTLTLNSGGIVSYVSGSASSVLTFNYTVTTGNSSSDLDYSTTSSLSLAGGTITDAAGNAATLTLPLTGGGSSIGGQKNIVIDGIAPSVSSIGVPANATYAAGQNLNFTVNYSEAVVVTGTPYIPITLETGGTVNASYQSGSGTTALVFGYSVATGNYDNDGISIGSAIALNSGTLKDAAGNNASLTLNGAGSTTGVLVDGIAPTVSSVSSTTANGTYKTGDGLAVTVTFSEAVTVTGTPTLSLNSGGSASYASGSGSTVLTFNYTVTTGNSSSDLDYSTTSSLSLAGGTIKDAAGNSATLTLPLAGGGSSLGDQKNIIIDGIAPSVSSVGILFNETYGTGQNLDFTVNFNEPVTVVSTGGTPYFPITLSTGGTVNASYQSGSGTSALVFRYTVAAGNYDNDGVAVGSAIALNSGTIKDAAGNNATLTLNGAGTTTGVLVDGIAPTVLISSAAGNPTKNSPIPVTITFSEPVTGFDESDINVGNGTKSNFNGSGTTYTLDITPSAQGTVTVDIAGGATTDAAGNGNTAAIQFSTTFDNLSPTVTISSTTGNLTNASPIPVNITFSEPVTGFDASDITVTNGTKGTLTGSGASYTIDITPSDQGAVTVNVAAGVATDAAGNSNSSATQLSRIYDSQAPSVNVTSTVQDPTNQITIPVKIVFSEAVTGFTLSDIILYGGTASDLQTTDNIHWTANVTFSANMGAKSIDIAAGTVQDLAGNGNTAAPYFQRTYDPKPPTITLSSTSPNPTRDKPMVVNISFSETVWNFSLSDIKVTNGTASNLQMLDYYQNWTVDIYPAADGVVTVDIPAGAAQDYATNNNTAAAQFSRTCDITSPTVVISSTSTASTNSNPIPLTITFSEPVSGFDADDITVVNGSKGAITGSGSTYTIDITPSAQGPVTVNIGANVAQDALGNGNIAAAQFSRTFDNIAPSVSSIGRQTPAADVTNASSVTYRITFNENVNGLDVSDFSLVPTGTATGTIASVSSASGTTIDVTVNSINGNGTLGLNLNDTGTGITDDSGNNISTGYTSGQVYTIDKTAPSVTISSVTNSSTNISPIPVTFTFSEPVTGFDAADITVTNGTKGTLSGSGTTYTLNITPSVSGVVSVWVSASVATDAAGNENTAAVSLSRTFDNESPSVSISSTATNPTNASPIVVTIAFSEAVTGFDIADITISNGTKGTLTGSGNNYSLTVTPLSPGIITVNVSAGIASDAAGNTNSAAGTFSITYTTDYFISGNAGMAGVTLGYTDGTSKSIVADANGDYIIAVPAGWNGTITPEKAGYSFTPVSKSYLNVLSDQLLQNYSAQAVTYTISGNTGVGVTTLSYTDGSAKTATSDASGNYSFTVSWNWSGTVSVSKDGYTFSANKTYTNVLSNQTSQDYLATAITYTISGNAGVAGATLSYTDGSAKTATSDASGNYSFTVSWNWSGTVSVSKDGYTFSANKTFTNVLSNQTSQDYMATAITFTISGNAGVSGATLSYTDGSAKKATSDASGNYSFTVSWNWSGTVSVSKDGYTFSANKTYTNVLSNQTSQDYLVTAITYTISGNSGIGGATLSYTDGSAKTATSDASGNYSFTVSWNWSGTVSVSKAGYTFSADKVYANVRSDQTSQNYSATPVTGIDEITQSQTKIYPTVNSGKFKLTTDIPENGKLLVRVINLQSTAVEQFQFTKTSSSATFEITLRNPVIGLYLVEISMNGSKQVKRIIVE